MATNYEQQRLENMARNKALLQSLIPTKVDFVLPPPDASGAVTEGVPAKEASKKRGRESTKAAKPAKKKARRVLASVDPDSSSLRRSARHSGRRVSYVDLGDASPERSPRGKKENKEDDYDDDSDEESDEGDFQASPQRKAQKLGVRVNNPKTFGNIPGVEVGRWWASRMECSTDAIHAPTVCGIAGSWQAGGAYSIALSGGYDDDVDEGDMFTYTGAGGRDLKGTKSAPKNLRTAPQSKDQSFETTYNKALVQSVESRYPVRVIRGFKLKSKYAPKTGYRYDGLYVVEKAWMETGLNPGGFKVCKYALRRLPDQPPIPVNKAFVENGDGDTNDVEGENDAEGEAGDGEAGEDGEAKAAATE